MEEFIYLLIIRNIADIDMNKSFKNELLTYFWSDAFLPAMEYSVKSTLTSNLLSFTLKQTISQ